MADEFDDYDDEDEGVDYSGLYDFDFEIAPDMCSVTMELRSETPRTEFEYMELFYMIFRDMFEGPDNDRMLH